MLFVQSPINVTDRVLQMAILNRDSKMIKDVIVKQEERSTNAIYKHFVKLHILHQANDIFVICLSSGKITQHQNEQLLSKHCVQATLVPEGNKYYLMEDFHISQLSVRVTGKKYSLI